MSSPQLPVPISPFEQEAIPWMADVFRFALSLTGEKADAEDIVQETYLRAHRSWHTYEIGSDCRRWLFAICRNVFLRWRRQHREVPMHEAASLDWGFNPAREPEAGQTPPPRTSTSATQSDARWRSYRSPSARRCRSLMSMISPTRLPRDGLASRSGQYAPDCSVGDACCSRDSGAFAMDAGLLRPAVPSLEEIRLSLNGRDRPGDRRRARRPVVRRDVRAS